MLIRFKEIHTAVLMLGAHLEVASQFLCSMGGLKTGQPIAWRHITQVHFVQVNKLTNKLSHVM